MLACDLKKYDLIRKMIREASNQSTLAKDGLNHLLSYAFSFHDEQLIEILIASGVELDPSDHVSSEQVKEYALSYVNLIQSIMRNKQLSLLIQAITENPINQGSKFLPRNQP